MHEAISVNNLSIFFVEALLRWVAIMNVRGKNAKGAAGIEIN